MSDTKSGFTQAERAAMKERAKELKQAKGGAKAADDLQAVLDKIAQLPADDRVLAERVHAVVTAAAPGLAPKLWYGMPAYARDGKIVCWFKDAGKFKMRYATVGFEDPAHLDDGAMWPTAFALTKWTAAVEKELGALVKKAAD